MRLPTVRDKPVIEVRDHIDVKMGSERNFGIVFAVVFALVGLYPLVDGESVRLWALAIALAFVAIAFVYPRALTLPNKLWFKFGMFLGAIVAPVVMALVFITTVTPLGLLARLAGKDLLREKMDADAKSYWQEREQPVGTMKRQF